MKMVFVFVVSLLVVHIEIVVVMSRAQVGSMLLILYDMRVVVGKGARVER